MTSNGGRTRGLGGVVAVAALALLAVALRAAWPLADPPDGMSWSGGIYTDPPYNYLAARYALLDPGVPTETLSIRLLYPLLTALVHLLGRVLPITRLSTSLLSVTLASVALFVTVWTVRRTSGRRAAVLALALGAVFHWLILFSRILMVENLVAPLLALAALAAVGRSTRTRMLAALLAVGAAAFGKYQALGPALGILAFMILRTPDRRTILAVLSTAAAVILVWMLILYLPHRAEIHWVCSLTSAGQEAPLILQSPLAALLGVFRTYRNAFLVHRAPVIALAGGAFVLWTLGNGDARRRRLADGSAVFAFWFAGTFLVNAGLAYAPPRYSIPLAYPLFAAAACQLAELARPGPVPSMKRLDSAGPLLLLCLFAGVGVSLSVTMWGHFVRDTLLLERRLLGGAETGWLRDMTAHLATLGAQIRWGVPLGAVLFGVVVAALHRRSGQRLAGLPRLATAALTLAVVINLGQWAWWATHRTERIATIQRSLAAMCGEGAVVLGAYAPLLTEGSSALAVWYPMAPEERVGGVLDRRGVTHLLLPEPFVVTAEDLDVAFPGLLEHARIVHTWRVHFSSVRRLHLYRMDGPLPGKRNSYRPTELELACEAGGTGKLDECGRRISRYRAAGGPDTPELLLYEGICLAARGELDAAEARLRRATRLDPGAPDIFRALGMVAARQGESDAATGYWLRAMCLDPEDRDVGSMLRRALEERGGGSIGP